MFVLKHESYRAGEGVDPWVAPPELLETFMQVG